MKGSVLGALATLGMTLIGSVILVPSAGAAVFQSPMKELYCKALFTPVPSASFLRSEDFRLDLNHVVETHLHDLETFETMQKLSFREAIRTRSLIAEDVIQSNIEMSPTLTQMHMSPTDLPPEIAAKTLEAMSDRQLDPQLLRARLERDPYFAWLKHNSLKYELRTKLTSRNRVGQQKAQLEPAILFLRLREMGLPPDLALMQTQVRLDPTLSSSAVASGEDALVLHEARVILERSFMPFTAIRDRNDTSAAAWNAIPSLREGQQILRRLFDHHIEKFGARFPRAAFERAQILSKNGDRVMGVIERYAIQRHDGFSEPQILTHLHEPLVALRDKIGLPKDFPLSDLYPMIKDVLRRKSHFAASTSYEMFMVRNFKDTGGLNERIVEIHRLIEIAEIFSQKEENVITYLQEVGREAAKKYQQ